MKALIKFFRDAWALLLALRDARKSGDAGPLLLVSKQGLADERFWIACQDRDYKQMQKCILSAIENGGVAEACAYCDEYGSCGKKEQVNYRGCEDWFLLMMDATEIETARKCAGIGEEAEKDEQSAAKGPAEGDTTV